MFANREDICLSQLVKEFLGELSARERKRKWVKHKLKVASVTANAEHFLSGSSPLRVTYLMCI